MAPLYLKKTFINWQEARRRFTFQGGKERIHNCKFLKVDSQRKGDLGSILRNKTLFGLREILASSWSVESSDKQAKTLVAGGKGEIFSEPGQQELRP